MRTQSEPQSLLVNTELQYWRDARRHELTAARKAVPTGQRRQWNNAITERLQTHFAALQGVVDGGYWPFRGEPDLLVLSQRLLAKWADGGIKLHVLRAALLLRARHRDLFIRGEYEPLLVDDHVVAFARSGRGVRAVTVVPRLSYRLTRGEQPWPVGAVWGDRQLPVPPGIYRDVLTGQRYLCSGTFGLAVLLEHLPVALLISEGETQ